MAGSRTLTRVEEATDQLSFDVGDVVEPVPITGDQWPVALLLAFDLFSAAVALPLALLLLSTSSSAESNSLSRFWTNVANDASFPVAIVIALAIAGFYRSSRRARYESSFSELKELAIALCAGCVLSIGFSVLLHVGFGVTESNSTQLLLAAVMAVALITLAHATLSAFRRNENSRVLIIGSGTLVDRIATYFTLTKGVKVIGRVVDAPTAEDGSLGTVSDLPQLCEKYQVNRIIVAFPTVLSHDSVTVFRSLPSSVHIAIVPRYFELVSWRSRITDLYGLPLVEVAPAHFSKWDRFLKRGFDIIAGSLLLLLLSPVALTIALLVKFTSPGPVLFRQERVGRGRQVFTIYKFRTMVDSGGPPTSELEPDKQHAAIPLHELRNKAEDSKRITRVGGVMRRAGLDEIPQFFNVLLGNMSLVGPRPFTEYESETVTGWQARRFELRPGITGLWQVSGRNDLNMDELRRLDYLYVASWSLWWDVKIVWDTPRAMVRGFGAY
jgi:exopolysaccharide biosynthesis polyprenyl glycosylphosphotransferase